MSLRLPPRDHPVRELIDMEFLASLGEPENMRKLSSLQEVKAKAAAAFASDPRIRSIDFMVLRASGDLELMRFDSQGGERTLWQFGKLYEEAVPVPDETSLRPHC